MKKKTSQKTKKEKTPALTLGTAAINDYNSNGGGGDLYQRLAAAGNFASKMQEYKNTWVFANNNKDAKYFVFVNNGKDFVNGVDAFYFAGHGVKEGPFLGRNSDYTGPSGKEMKCVNYDWSGNKLKWMMLDCCSCLNDGTSTNTNPVWSGTSGILRWEHAFNYLKGTLHAIFALRSLGWDVSGTGKHFAENIYYRNYSNGYAWIDAVDWEQYFGGVTSQGVAPAVLSSTQGNIDWYNESMLTPWVNPGDCDPKTLQYSYTWLWKGTPLFRKSSPGKMKIYKTKANPESLLKDIAKQLGLRTPLKRQKGSASISGKNYVISQAASGGLIYIDSTARPDAEKPVPAGIKAGKAKIAKISIPSLASARKTAEAFIGRLRLTGDGSPVFLCEEKLMRSSSKGKRASVIELRLTFGRQLDGINVAGAGSRIVVRLGHKGEILGCVIDWPEINSGKNAASLRPFDEASKDLEALIELVNQKMFPQDTITSFTIKQQKQSYFGVMTEQGSRNIVPCYLVTIIAKTKSGQGFELELPLAATEKTLLIK